MEAVTGGPDYTARVHAEIPNLRAASATKCFLTPGEIAIPLADYADELIRQSKPAYTSYTLEQLQGIDGYWEARNSLYRHVSNLITVNSDVFAANIVIMLVDDDEPDEDKKLKGKWHYITVLDRGNITAPEHLPAVLMFAEVK